MIIINHCLVNKNKKVLVVSYELTKMRNTVIKDFQVIMKSFNKWSDSKWNGSFNTYNFDGGSQLIFMPADKEDSGKGLRSDVCYFNECDKIPFENFLSIHSRTNRTIIDYNPTSRTYIDKDIISDTDSNFLRLTFLDNEALGEAERSMILSYKEKAEQGSKFYLNKWRVFGLGEHGVSEDNIFDFDEVETIPTSAKLHGYGLDFGYTNDPTACVALYEMDSVLYAKEILYEKGLSNKQISDRLKDIVGRNIVICDSAEPKSIAELRAYGIQALPTVKSNGSVNYGIQLIQSNKLKVDKHSYNLQKELEGYCWIKDKRTGEVLNIPQDYDNHLIDALRYAVLKFKNVNQKSNAYA